MKNLILSFRSFALLLLLSFTSLSAFGQAGLILSQIYGGGGNSGATYTNDFIELYNSTASPISLGGLSVQYASATGTSWNAATLPSVSLAPGHYYLIEAAAGTTAALALPTPDLILTLGPPSNVSSTFLINLSATAGKVALVSGVTPLTVACPTGATIIDFVGYGTTANCFEGAGAAPTTTNNATSILRTNSTDTNNNAADFSTVSPPNPRNSSYVAGGLSATGTATPSVLNTGGTTLLTVTVTPATLPAASTGIAVAGNLTSIGGSAAQPFYDDGTHGDVTSGDNIFSFSTTATVSASGAVNVSATVTDQQSNTANVSIPLTVNLPVPVVAIHDIQGVKSTTAATVSPYANQVVQTNGVVTTVLSNGFFIQSRDSDIDSNLLTPEGVEVFTSSQPTVAVGNYVQVVGTVSTYPAVTASHTPATEITAPAVTVLSASVPLPAAISLDATMLTAAGGLYQLTPYEGMRVKIASMTAISGTNGSITAANEAAETATSTGYFYAVITGTARPFREPGIDIRDTPLPGAPANIAKFDDNPERILVDSTLAGGTSLEISTGTILPNVTGVLDFTFSSDSFYDPSRLILDATYNRTQVSGGMTVQALPAAGAKQFTVASFNIERFYNTLSTDDLYWVPAGVTGYNGNSTTGTVSTGQTYTSAAVDVTSLAAYQRRLQKVALAICNVLNAPDIVTLEEVENQSVANDIAAQINTTCSVGYTAYSTDNSAAYTQDGTGISVGFLVKNSTVDPLGLAQVGANETFTSNGSTLTLNDRPWLALNAGIKRAGAKDYPVIVIVNHLRSLSSINANTSSGANARTKKELQAEEMAKFIQSLQAQGLHVISGGDFNAFEFSDGYTDTLATYTNTNVLSADKVVVPGVAGLVTPPLSDLTLTLAANQRWSYVEDGNAQVLDHIVVTPELVSGSHLAYAHMNADFPVTAYNDATTAARTSDHDPVVGYFTVPDPVLTAILLPASADFGSSIVGVATAGTVFTLGNIGEATISISGITVTGDFAQTNNCGATLAVNASCKVNVVFTPTAGGNRTGQLSILTNVVANPYIAPLTGVGAVPDFTLADSAGKSTTTVSVAAGSTGTASLVYTPVSGFNGAISTTCVAQGTAPAGVTCTAPATFTLSGTAAVTQTVSFATTSRVKTSGIALTSISRSPWSAALLLTLAGFLMLLAGRTRRLARIGGLLALLLAILLPAIGCAGGGSGSSTNPGGTPAGSYTYTVTATSGATSHVETVTLVVQ